MININFAVRDRQIYNDKAMQISIPTLDGEITVLAGHIPLITVIVSGELKIIDIKSQEHSYAVTRGVVNIRNRSEVMETEVLLMCDDAIASDAIDIATEEEAISRAEEVIKNGESYQDISGLISPLERELNRIRIAKRR